MAKNKSSVCDPDQKTTSSSIRDLARSVSASAPQAPDYPPRSTPLVVTLWAANGDKAELQKLGFDFDNVIWRSFDIQPMAKHLRPKGKVAGKEGLNPQYKLIEASEQFNLGMTTQNNLLASYTEGIPRADRDPVQHCAVDDAFNTVRLTGLLLEDFADVDALSSLEEASPSEAAWPPEGQNTRILSIDTESCCLPEHANSPRGQKYPSLLSELGIALIDTDTIRAYPLDWQERITTAHAIIAEHWNYHPNRRAQDNMGIDDREPFCPRFNASSGASGSLQEERTFAVDGESYTVTMSPDSEIISQDRCLEWLLAKVQQEAPVNCLPLSLELARRDSAQGTIGQQEK